MKSLTIALLSLLALSTTAPVAKAFDRCPRFVADKATGTYQTFSSALPGRVCGNNARALKRAGFVPAGPNKQPPVIQNPELDLERTFQGRGATTINPAFRVSSVARVVTATLVNCPFDTNLTNIYFIISDERGSQVGDFFKSFPADGSPISFSIFDRGVFGVQVYYPTSDGPCDAVIQVQ